MWKISGNRIHTSRSLWPISCDTDVWDGYWDEKLAGHIMCSQQRRRSFIRWHNIFLVFFTFHLLKFLVTIANLLLLTFSKQQWSCLSRCRTAAEWGLHFSFGVDIFYCCSRHHYRSHILPTPGTILGRVLFCTASRGLSVDLSVPENGPFFTSRKDQNVPQRSLDCAITIWPGRIRLLCHALQIFLYVLVTLYGHIKTAEQLTIIHQYGGWYTGRWWVLHLVQRGGAWAGCGPAQSPPHCTKCNSPPISGQCTNFRSFDMAL